MSKRLAALVVVTLIIAMVAVWKFASETPRDQSLISPATPVPGENRLEINIFPSQEFVWLPHFGEKHLESFQYSLRKFSDGMTIDPVLGELRWRPSLQQSGTMHSVVVNARYQSSNQSGRESEGKSEMLETELFLNVMSLSPAATETTPHSIIFQASNKAFVNGAVSFVKKENSEFWQDFQVMVPQRNPFASPSVVALSDVLVFVSDKNNPHEIELSFDLSNTRVKRVALRMLSVNTVDDLQLGTVSTQIDTSIESDVDEDGRARFRLTNLRGAFQLVSRGR